METVGFFAVLSLFIANAFHFNIYQQYVYYRELFAVIFAILILARLLVLGRDNRLINRTMFYLLLFPVFLFIWSFIDPGVPLYGGYDIEGVSSQLDDVPLTLYVLRNSLLYIPLVVYFYIRGINIQELRIVAATAIFISPFSVFAYLASGELENMALTLGGGSALGGQGIAYNSYVPYLTFHVLCGIYLLFSPGNRFIKLMVLLCVVVTSLFILFSTSRQSVLFILLTFVSFLYLTNNRGWRVSKWLTVGIIVVGSLSFALYLTREVELADTFLIRFGSVQGFISDDESGRINSAIHGIAMLNPFEWLFGAGLTSVIVSGPHNDYIRWVQRIGIPMMILGFLPFIRAFVRCARLSRMFPTANSIFVFLALATGFTLYHSIFGYPREDANQAVAVYLGLALWFGAYRDGLIPTLGRRTQKFVSHANQNLSSGSRESI